MTPRLSSPGLTALLVGAALTCIGGEYVHLAILVYLAKPLATITTILIAVRSDSAVRPGYRAWITAGLVWSLVGDVFLMLPGDRFVGGLASFLVAHVLYTVAFARNGGGRRDAKAAGVFGVAAVMLLVLWPSLGALRVPVTAYVTVIATMAWQALVRWRHVQTTDARLAAIGALSFLVSDSALAMRRFHGDFPGGVVIVLGTYWVAQWCIARSVTTGKPQRTD
jgi:uncharacterized membrane protein YhhN